MKFVNICNLLDELFPNNAWIYETSQQEISASVDKWCKDNNAYHYARGREEFNKYEAVKLAAKQAGCNTVLLEDLS